MPNYIRARVAGATYFFTVNLAARCEVRLTDNINLLRGAYGRTIRQHPVICEAMVVLPDHLHAVWTLPVGDADFSSRWRKIKARFSHGLRRSIERSRSEHAKRETGVWQRRFWEHKIRDQADLAEHVAYCWNNPVKHGFAAQASDWPYSSIHRDILAGKASTLWRGSDKTGDFGER